MGDELKNKGNGSIEQGRGCDHCRGSIFSKAEWFRSKMLKHPMARICGGAGGVVCDHCGDYVFFYIDATGKVIRDKEKTSFSAGIPKMLNRGIDG